MNRKVTYLLAFFLLLACKLNAQIGNDATGSRSAAMGGASVTLSDLWSTNNNQAGMAFVNELTGGIHYENRFLLSETAYRSGVFVFPTKLGAIGASVTSFGFSAFKETKLGLSYGQKIGNSFSLGVQLNYLSTSFDQEYESKKSVIGAVGFIAKLSDELKIGVHIYNPTRTQLATFDDERLATIMKLGLDYRFSKKVILLVETEKDVGFNAVLKVGIEYHIVDRLYLRGGVSNNPQKSAFGIGLKLKGFNLELSSSYHQVLGLTPGISLIYKKAKK